MKWLIIILCLLLGGCSTISGWRDKAALKAGYTSKAHVESLIEQVKKENADKLAANDKLTADAQASFESTLGDKAQFASNSLYAADLAYLLCPNPDRTHRIMDNKVNEARVVLPPPTVEAMAAQNAEIKRLLDETQTSLEQLKAAHQSALQEAAQVKERAVKAENDLATAKQARVTLEAEEARQLAAKQAELNKANDDVIAAEHKRGDDADARHALMTKLSLGAGLLAALCVAGAIWSPVFKPQFGIAGFVFGASTVGIWYLTPVLLLSGAGIAGFGIAIWAALNHHTSTKTTTALVNAVQDVKEKMPEVYASTIKPVLTDWTTKYTKAPDGTTMKVEDRAVTANIDSTLTSSNRV